MTEKYSGASEDLTEKKVLVIIFIFSTAESIQLCYTSCNVVHVCIVYVLVVYVVLINLITTHYNIIMKMMVASGGKLPIP